MCKHKSAWWLLCLGKPPGVSEVRELSPVPQLGMGDLHGKVPLFWAPTEREQHSHVSIGGKYCKMPFGVMAPARINGTVKLSKAQINNCWHLQNTSPPFGKYHLMTELMKGPQTSHTSTTAKKSYAIYGHSSLLGRYSFCCSPLLILVTHFIPPLQHLTLQDNQSVVTIHTFFRKLGTKKNLSGCARNSWFF